jgi:ABC-type nitrate/sulfonate/bicarbonate transport system permease component
VAARLVEAAGGADSDTLNDNEVEALQQVERQRTRMLLGFGAAAVVAVVLGLIVAMR